MEGIVADVTFMVWLKHYQTLPFTVIRYTQTFTSNLARAVPSALVCFGDLNTQSQPSAISLDVGKYFIAGLASVPTPPSSQHPEPGQNEVENAVSRQISPGMHSDLIFSAQNHSFMADRMDTDL